MRRWLVWLLCVGVFLLGRQLNVWQVATYGAMPLSYPWGDWIPYKQYLLSIGDVMQFVAWLTLFGYLFFLLGISHGRGQTWK